MRNAKLAFRVHFVRRLGRVTQCVVVAEAGCAVQRTGRPLTAGTTESFYGHKRQVSVTAQYSMRRTFAPGRREAIADLHVVLDSLIA